MAGTVLGGVKITLITQLSQQQVSRARVHVLHATGGFQTASLSGTGVSAQTFSISASPSTAAISAGHPANFKITVAPANGRVNNFVSLSCSDLPATVTCSLSPDFLTTGPNPASSTLTITMTSAGRHFPVDHPLAPDAAGLAQGSLALLALSFMVWAPNTPRLIGAFGLILVCTLVVFQIACATNTGLGGLPSVVRSVSKTITVTATTGSPQTSAKLTLVVN